MNKMWLSFRNFALPILIWLVGVVALIYSVVSKWNLAINDRELRTYEHLLAKGNESTARLAEFVTELQRSLGANSDEITALVQLNIQAIPATRSNPLEMQPGEIQVLKIGKLARFEGRLSSGQFVKSLGLDLRVFPSQGDPPIVLLGAKNSSVIFVFSFDFKVVLVALSPVTLRKYLGDFILSDDPSQSQDGSKSNGSKQSLEWALVSIPSAWAVKKQVPGTSESGDKTAPAKSESMPENDILEFIDRANLDTFQLQIEKKRVLQLAAIPDQIQTIPLRRGAFPRELIMGSSKLGNTNLRLIFSQQIVLTSQESFALVFREVIVLVSSSAAFFVILYLQRKRFLDLLQKSQTWITTLPLTTPVAPEFLQPSNTAATLIRTQLQHAEFLVQSWNRDVFFLRSIVSDLLDEQNKDFVYEERLLPEGEIEDISWENSPDSSFGIFVSIMALKNGTSIICFSVREPKDFIGKAITMLKFKKIQELLSWEQSNNLGKQESFTQSDDTSNSESAEANFSLAKIEKVINEVGFEKFLASDLNRTCLIFLTFHSGGRAITEILPPGGFEFKAIESVHSLKYLNKHLLTINTSLSKEQDTFQHDEEA